MHTIHINQLIGNLIIVTTPENLQVDLESKITSTILKAIQSVQGQGLENPIQNLDKCSQQSSTPASSE